MGVQQQKAGQQQQHHHHQQRMAAGAAQAAQDALARHQPATAAAPRTLEDRIDALIHAAKGWQDRMDRALGMGVHSRRHGRAGSTTAPAAKQQQQVLDHVAVLLIHTGTRAFWLAVHATFSWQVLRASAATPATKAAYRLCLVLVTAAYAAVSFTPDRWLSTSSEQGHALQLQPLLALDTALAHDGEPGSQQRGDGPAEPRGRRGSQQQGEGEPAALDVEAVLLSREPAATRCRQWPRCQAVVRSPETKHCIYCDVCVPGWDHHCTWVGRCVRRGPVHLLFMVYVTAQLAIIVPAMHASVSSLRGRRWRDEAFWVFALVFLGVSALLLGSLLVLHLSLVATGRTTYQAMRPGGARRALRCSSMVRNLALFCARPAAYARLHNEAGERGAGAADKGVALPEDRCSRCLDAAWDNRYYSCC